MSPPEDAHLQRSLKPIRCELYLHCTVLLSLIWLIPPLRSPHNDKFYIRTAARWDKCGWEGRPVTRGQPSPGPRSGVTGAGVTIKRHNWARVMTTRDMSWHTVTLVSCPLVTHQHSCPLRWKWMVFSADALTVHSSNFPCKYLDWRMF